jgi:hypothetical protein
MSALSKVAALIVSTAIGVAMAGCTTTGITSTQSTAQAASPTAQRSDDPPCGYDVYHGRVYVLASSEGHNAGNHGSLGYKYKGETVRKER